MNVPPPPMDLPYTAHKGDAGRVLAAVGSRTMPGAASLVARAAQRAGAGLVTLAVPDRDVIAAVAPAAPEAIFLELTGLHVERGRLPAELRDARADVRLIGCGRGNDEATRALVRAMADDSFDGVLVVDADGLNAVAGEPERLRGEGAGLVTTPHPGEAARLLAREVGASEEARVAAADEIALRSGGICVLKGAGTVVSDGTRRWIAETGNPGMATAGAGDVLAGILVGYLCVSQRFHDYDRWDAVRAAVHVHGVAGDVAADRLGARAVVASDLIECLADAQRLHAEAFVLEGRVGERL